MEIVVFPVFSWLEVSVSRFTLRENVVINAALDGEIVSCFGSSENCFFSLVLIGREIMVSSSLTLEIDSGIRKELRLLFLRGEKRFLISTLQISFKNIY